MEENKKSPEWSTQTKTLVVAVLLVVMAFLFVTFQSIIPPLLVAFIIAYLLYPVASFMQDRVHIPWTVAVTILFVAMIVVLIGLVTWGGVEIVTQFQEAVKLVEAVLDRIVLMIQQVPVESLPKGILRDFLERINLAALAGQIEPTMERLGTLIGAVATGAFSTIGWIFFILLFSYFLLIESDGIRAGIFSLNLRKYNDDAVQIGARLSHIWNSFLRGQLIIVLLAIFIYTLLLNLLGIRYAFGLALLAGLARFMPYVGPMTFWIILGFVAFFQDYRLFGVSPTVYVIMAVGAAMIVDYILDNLVYARVMADTLKVHPAAILVAIVIAADLFGLLGILIAAPILATMQLFLTYTLRKLFNEPPWPEDDENPHPPPLHIQFRNWLLHLRLPRKTR